MTEPKSFVRRARQAAATAVFARGGAAVTDGDVSLEELRLSHPDRRPYVPSPWWGLRWILPKADVRSTDVFVDFGCGKGRVVFEAARRYPFTRVVGVEMSEELSEAARALVQRNRSRLTCQNVVIVAADAAVFHVPDDMTIAYMFNPFVGEVFRRVLSNIIASLDRVPRALSLYYGRPVEEAAVLATGRFRLVRRMRTTRIVAPFEVAVFESLPGTAGEPSPWGATERGRSRF